MEREPSELPSTFLLETEHRARNDCLEDPWKETCSLLMSVSVFAIAVRVSFVTAIHVIMTLFFHHSYCIYVQPL